VASADQCSHQLNDNSNLDLEFSDEHYYKRKQVKTVSSSEPDAATITKSSGVFY